MQRIVYALLALFPSLAWAGGFDIPDNGTEALGRGGAFVAKADDGTAIEYNIAGLARQKGTRLTFDNNLLFHDTAFTRAGAYPSMPNDSSAPYFSQPYPTMHDSEKIFWAPFLALSSDLGGLLKHWTVAVGVYGPPAIGTHNYGVGAAQCDAQGVCEDPEHPPAKTTLSNGVVAPAPTRYDVTRTNLLIAFPTLAVAYQPHPMIEFGAAWQIVYANFDIANANLTPLGPGNCPTPDYAGCDAYGRVRTSGTSFTSSPDGFKGKDAFSPHLGSFGWIFSVMMHPTNWIDLGATVRPQIDVQTVGTLHASPPSGIGSLGPDATAIFTTTLPAWMRLGGRVVSHYADGSERGDIELDLVWENWDAEKFDHIHAKGESLALSPDQQIDANVIHNYHDTFGVRLGGAYTHPLGENFRLTGRLGLYFDSAATDARSTRLDFNTVEKLGLTAGLGIKWKGILLNAAYAFVYTPDRTVNDSDTYALSAINGSNLSATDAVIPVGNGTYHMTTQILSVGLTFTMPERRFRQHGYPN